MKYRMFLMMLLLARVQCNSNLIEPITETLNKYKSFLVLGTYEGQDWSQFTRIPKSRYYTFKKAFCYFVAMQGKVIVELGTSRSFVHGGLPGCNSSDIQFWKPHNPECWDWGAGFFTRMVAESLAFLSPRIHTVDICAEHIERCKIMTSDFSSIISYHVASSVDFLAQLPSHSIDLLYVDTGDMTPIEPTAQLQLEEAKIIVEKDLIVPGGIILIDDVRNQTPKQFGEISELGKAKYSLPYFLEHGFTLVEDEYQVLLQKKKS
jgi:hypothetical protein